VITKIEASGKYPVVELALDTLRLGKQALVFVNTKRSAEKCAELIAGKRSEVCLSEFAHQIEGVLQKPTSQCSRLAKCALRGVAFHHAGLHSKQRELIEEGFRESKVQIICCTTTMAAGVDLPAFRSIIRDVTRYGKRGMELIPVLEYHQAAGRAGRPGMEAFGEAIAIAKTEAQKEEIIERFILGKPEKIFSKLAVEPVLRTYVLSLITTRLAQSRAGLLEFFGRTFWAKQYGDTAELARIIDKMLGLLVKWNFVRGSEDFVCAANLDSLQATELGRRVSELYLDPLTADGFVRGIKRADKAKLTEFSLLQLVCFTLEMRPLLRVRDAEFEAYQEQLASCLPELLVGEPSYFSHEYGAFIDSVKTALMLLEWIDEKDEDELIEKYNSRPGETRYKLEQADWLLFALKELAEILGVKGLNPGLDKLRVRLKYGVKEELVPLLKLKNIGRVRARKLYQNGLKGLGDVRRASISLLANLLGEKIARGVKEQLGMKNEKGIDKGLKLYAEK
jgi:helicase